MQEVALSGAFCGGCGGLDPRLCVGAMNPHADTFAPLRWHAELQAMLTRIQTYHQRRAPGGWRST